MSSSAATLPELARGKRKKAGLGLDAYRFLVFPRVLALVLVMPVLVVMADAVGISGGLVVGITGFGCVTCHNVNGDKAAGIPGVTSASTVGA